MIIKCPTCGAHVPSSIAVEVPVGDHYEQYCSLRCAEAVGMQPPVELPAPPHRFLVAVDGSGPSLRATKYAARLAVSTGGNVELIHAIDPAVVRVLPLKNRPGDEAGHGIAERELEDRLRHDAEAMLERCRQICEAAGVGATTTLEYRAPQQAIAEAAGGCDLVVMGSRGLDATTSEMLGSLSQRVIADVITPVLVVH